jgi:transposase-like protein
MGLVRENQPEAGRAVFPAFQHAHPHPCRCFRTSQEIIRPAVMLQVRFPVSIRNVEDLLHEPGFEAGHEAVR